MISSKCGPLPQKKPSRIAVNVYICREPKDVFDKDINLLVPDAEKQAQSVNERIAPNNLGIFEDMNKEKWVSRNEGQSYSANWLIWQSNTGLKSPKIL